MPCANSTNPSFTIDPEFRDYLPKQSAEQTATLTAKILAEGVLPGSLVVGEIGGELFLIDGHHTFRDLRRARHRIPRTANFPFR